MRTPKDPKAELGARFFLKKLFVNYNGKLHPIPMVECVCVRVDRCKKNECWVDGQTFRDINPYYPYYPAYKVLWRDLIPYDSVKCCHCPLHCPSNAH